jgi:Fe-S-cluster-containing dehydrogenase component
MKQWFMIIDVAKCEDCNNCMLACRDEHVGNDWPGYTAPQPSLGQRWINIERCERGQFPLIDVAYRPTPCMHCADAPCIAVSGGTITRRPDGIVLIDPVKARGQQHLAGACPYGAIWWNEELQLPQKCTFCAHLLDTGWKQPRCVQACPTGAMEVHHIEPDEMRRLAGERHLKPLHPEFGASPQTLYANLYRFDSCFIAGSVAETKNGITDCVAGVTVHLRRAGIPLAECTTDAFGDFKFDGLLPGSTGYTLFVEASDGRYSQFFMEQLDSSWNIGTICLAELPPQK